MFGCGKVVGGMLCSVLLYCTERWGLGAVRSEVLVAAGMGVVALGGVGDDELLCRCLRI